MDTPLIGNFKNPDRKIWLLKMPTALHYVEDVKSLAREHGLKIVNEDYRKDFEISRIAVDAPTITTHKEKARAELAKKEKKPTTKKAIKKEV